MKIWFAIHHDELSTFVAGFLFFAAITSAMNGSWLSAVINLIFVIFNLKLARWF